MSNNDFSSSPYYSAALSAANSNGIPEDLFVAQIGQESGFNPSAQNGNATGIAQFMPGTASSFGIDPTDPVASLNAAAQYDAQLYNKTGSYSGMLSAYGTVPQSGPINAGQQNVYNIAQGYDSGQNASSSGPIGVTSTGSGSGNNVNVTGVGIYNSPYDALTANNSDGYYDPSSLSTNAQGQITANATDGSGQYIIGQLSNSGSSTGSSDTSNGSDTLGLDGSSSSDTSLGGLGSTANSLLGGGSSTSTTAIQSYITQIETWFGNWFVRLGVIILGIIIITVALFMFKPVQRVAIQAASKLNDG